MKSTGYGKRVSYVQLPVHRLKLLQVELLELSMYIGLIKLVSIHGTLAYLTSVQSQLKSPKNCLIWCTHTDHFSQISKGYDSFSKPFSYQTLIGKKFKTKEVRLLLDDLLLLLKSQFVLSVEEFWNVYSYSYNIMKGLRINHFLGNLVWILEAYSKYKLGKELMK
ncbi:hypothetical protein ACFSTH_00915 [Paenibacillus yanchengensis]